ncbi:MAG TPA: tetratricopeptide repeat protein [Gemmataceae bacterium]|nr:tetratricopeptide repeat protein [Gemmataceae bacterium]
MNQRILCRGVVLLLLLPCLATGQPEIRRAQEPTVSEKSRPIFGDVTVRATQDERDRQESAGARIHEEIEIMRRILDQGIRRLSALPQGAVLSSWLSQNGPGKGAAFLDYDNDGKLDLWIANFQTPKDATQIWGHLGEDTNHALRKAHAGVAPFEAVEGFHLKGYGVVYTAALAAQFQETVRHVSGPAAKPLSEWERVRKELHGEKPEPGKKEPVQKHDSVADTLLRILAENGHNFTALADNEQVAIALTLRRGQDCMACHTPVHAFGDASHDAGNVKNLIMDSFQPLNGAGKAGPQKSGSGNKNQTAKEGKIEQGKSLLNDLVVDLDGRVQKSDAQNLMLLGDLNMKQGRYKEAAAAYQKALDDHRQSNRSLAAYGVSLLQNGEDWRRELRGEIAAVELASKFAQAALAAGNPDDALKALQEVAQYSNRLERISKIWKDEVRPNQGNKPSAKAAPLPLPAKLIITAPKRLLDQVGAGKITFEEFKKAAKVEYLNFAGSQAGSEK